MYMYKCAKGASTWRCATASELLNVQDIQLWLPYGTEAREDFIRRLDNGECVQLGVGAFALDFFRCTQCKPADECMWHRFAQRTEASVNEFYHRSCRPCESLR